MSLEEMPEEDKDPKPWIRLSEDDFDNQFGESIRVRLTNAIKGRLQAKGQEHKVVSTFDSPPSTSLPSADTWQEPAQDEFSRRFKSKVLTFGGRIQHSVFNGFQGDVKKFNQVDPNSPFLKGLLLDLLAYEFLKELGAASEDEAMMVERGRELLKQLSAWDAGLEPVRLLSLEGEWIDSHGKAIGCG
jgi:hypothetical protein